MKHFIKAITSSLLLALATAASAASPATPGAFTQGTVRGMEDVLILNPISKLVLAGAPDSVLFSAAYAIQISQFKSARNGEYPPNEVTGRHPTSDISVDLTMHSFFPDAATWGDPGRANKALQKYPDALRCGLALERMNGREIEELNYQAPQACIKGWDSKSGAQADMDPVAGYKLRVRELVKMVAAIKADVRKAEKFGVVIALSDGKPFDFSAGVGNVTKLGDNFVIPFQYFAGVSQNDQRVSNLRQRTEMTADGRWTFCAQMPQVPGSSDEKMFDVSHVRTGDAISTCLLFKGFSDVKIPTGLIVRDLSQFNPKKQRLAAVMVVSKPRVTRPELNDKGMATKGIEFAPIGWHVIDANAVVSITPEMVSVKTPGIFSTMDADTCAQRHAYHWGNRALGMQNADLVAKGAAACRLEEVKAKAQASGKSIAEVSRQIAYEELAK